MLKPEIKDLIDEFEWTRNRYGGDVTKAAPIFGMTPSGLEQVLRRANRENGEVIVRFKGVRKS